MSCDAISFKNYLKIELKTARYILLPSRLIYKNMYK